MARLSSLLRAATLSLLAVCVTAQVSTDCQPLEKSCPADPGFNMDYNFNFNTTPTAGTWSVTAGTVAYANDTGAAFTINKQGDSPTIRTDFYIFFGRVEMWIKTAPGTGIVSAVMLLSDDLDEIDLEFLGGNASVVSTNYFGKGREDYLNAASYPINGGSQADYHNYTIDWTSSALDYYIDGDLVRTLLPADANNTDNYPQTPARLSLGIWAGGDPTLPQGTRDWAGGNTNYDDGPFTMYVRSTQITDYGGGKEYLYNDNSGSWESINVTAGNSSVYELLNKEPTKSLSDKWNALPSSAHVAVYASAGGVAALIVGYALFYCISQRRRGAKEAALASERFAQEQLEFEQYKKAGINPDSLAYEGADYNAKEMAKDGFASSNAYSVPESSHAAAGGAAAAAAAGATPLLRDDPQSQSYAGNDAPGRMMSPAPLGSPMRSHSPGSPPDRSFSTPPVQFGSGGMDHSQSPASTTDDHPQRSYTTDGYQRPGENNGGGIAMPFGGRTHSGYERANNNDYWR